MIKLEKLSLLQNKKGWILRDWVTASILGSGIILFFTLFFLSLGSEYNNEDLINEQFNEHYNKLSELTDDINTMRKSSTAGEGLTFLGTFDVAFQATFTVVQLVWASFTTVATLPTSMVSDFIFIDDRVIDGFFIMLLSIITAIILFIWISSISRSKL